MDNFKDYVKFLLEGVDDSEGVKIINATPHPINLKVGSEEIVYPKSDILARVESKGKKVDDIEVVEGVVVDMYEYEYGEIQGLPKSKNGVYYIVSAMVLSANKETKSPRSDLIAPDTNGGAIREGGLIKAVTRFSV